MPQDIELTTIPSKDNEHVVYLCTFAGLRSEWQPLAGGKGCSLARLAQAGFNVPDGFVILPHAFAEGGLREAAWEQVLATIAAIRKKCPETTFAVRSSALAEDSAQASFAGKFETVLNVRSDEEIAAVIVTDVGGPLSHGSIVAREYAIPAVLGTGRATSTIQTGQTITVDGNRGVAF